MEYTKHGTEFMLIMVSLLGGLGIEVSVGFLNAKEQEGMQGNFVDGNKWLEDDSAAIVEGY